MPESDYLCCHNMAYESPSSLSFCQNDEPINLGFVGVIRYADECERILKAIENDSRIMFHFYGDGEDECRLKSFCKENGIENVLFHGRFLPHEKDQIYSQIDIIYNCYGNTTNNVKYALSNKYYDALYYKKPILVNNNTSMADYSGILGYKVEEYDTLADRLLQWYQTLNVEDINTFCDKKIIKYISENEMFSMTLMQKIAQGECDEHINSNSHL